jgi:butyrate kinase
MDKTENKLYLIKSILKLIKKEAKKMSAVGDAVQAFANQINEGLDEIATDIQDLQDLVAAGGTIEEVNAKLQPLLDKANAIKSIHTPGE